MTQSKLKPCPFCGKPVTYFYVGTGTFEIFHSDNKEDDCIVSGDGIMFNYREEEIGIDVVYAWNRRAKGDGV